MSWDGSTLGAPEPPPQQRTSALSEGYLLGGRYRIGALLGQGGMGTVYAATHVHSGLQVAIKVLLPEHARRQELVRRFVGEARAAAALHHPGIIRVTDFDRDGDLYYLVMEKLEGESLAERLRRTGPVAPEVAIRLALEICDAVGAAHGHTPRIVHRDLKPENVFLAREGDRPEVVKILDFGIAKLIHGDSAAPGDATLTVPGTVAGTPPYMAPEQLVDSRDVDERSDIYAIGVILFRAITGRLPYSASSLGELVLQVHAGPAPRISSIRPGVSPLLATVIEKALARDRLQRFQTAADMQAALTAVALGPRTTRRRAGPILTFAFLLVLAGAAASWARHAWRPKFDHAPADTSAHPTSSLATAPPSTPHAEPHVGQAAPSADRGSGDPNGIAPKVIPVAGSRHARPSAPPPAAHVDASLHVEFHPAAEPRRVCAKPLHWEHGIGKISTPEPATGDGLLAVRAFPWGQVSLCGTQYGEAPLELRVRAGTYTLRVEHASKWAEQTVSVEPGARLPVAIDLSDAASP